MKTLLTTCLATLATISTVKALEKEPWLYPPFEFHTGVDFDLSYYSNVNNGFNPLGYHSTNYDVKAHLIAPVSPVWDVELELELEQTRKYGFGFESVALQSRYQFLDDIQGDFVSLTGLFNIRVVPKQRLHDVTTPYHNLGNFELGFSVGKEFTKQFNWFLRTFLNGAIGQANKGYPWIRFMYKMEWKAVDCFVIAPFASGYFGLGDRKSVV